ncbi:hypothetical protein IG631_01876 [Alternaria alternata]|nr:hypothetical protein IG631_01876 [Alternaria alternata]
MAGNFSPTTSACQPTADLTAALPAACTQKHSCPSSKAVCMTHWGATAQSIAVKLACKSGRTRHNVDSSSRWCATRASSRPTNSRMKLSTLCTRCLIAV